MRFRRGRPALEVPIDEPRRRGLGPFLKRWTIPIIGALTPAGLIVVNISIFIAKHLAEFRLAIAALAFVSGLMLNSWAALNIYRLVQSRRPDHALVHERNQEIVLVGGMAIVIIAAFVTALFCYFGLANEADLPNGLTFFTGVLAALIPILGQAVFRRAIVGRRRDRPDAVTGLPSGASSTSLQDSLPHR